MPLSKPKREAKIVQEIRSYLLQEVGATVHKTTGGVFGERGVPDLFGTLPGGRALWLEVKAPGKLGTITKIQMYHIQNEARHGAVAGAVTSVEEVKQLLLFQGFDWRKPHTHPVETYYTHITLGD